MDGVEQQDSTPQNDSTLGFKWIKKSHKILCSHIFIIHNDHTYITEDYTSLCLNIICNRSYFILKWCQLSSGPTFTQGWKHIGENICLSHAQTAIYDSKVKLFLKGTGYEYDGNIFVAWVLLTRIIQSLYYALLY